MDLYLVGGDVVRKVLAGEGSLRNLVFGCDAQNNKKLLYKICLEVLRYHKVLLRVAELSKLARDRRISALENVDSMHVLLYEYLFGRRRNLQRVPFRGAFAKLESKFNAALAQCKSEGLLSSNGLPVSELTHFDQQVIPRYVRVNSLKSVISEVIRTFESDAWSLTKASSVANFKKFKKSASCLRKRNFMRDFHFPNDILIFPTGADFHDHRLYLNSEILLQNKSSCLATFCLAPPPGSYVLDCCAAPGMKTVHLSAMVQNSGKVFAVDRDFERVRTMRKLLARAGARNVAVIHKDFLRIDLSHKKFEKVEYVLLDPPCSGSGIQNRVDHQPAKYPKSRIHMLGNLQAMMLKHALGNLPNLKRLVYSTCSVFERENEEVVEEVLTSLKGKFRLVRALPHWKHRGRRKFKVGPFCLRASLKKDLTNGFFVAVFERTDSS